MSTIWFKLRTALYTVTLLTVSLWAVVIAFVATICGKRLNTNYYVARTFYYVGGTLMGWTIDVEGEEYLWEGTEKGDKTSGKHRSAVMVGNHQSFVDILYLGRIFPKAAAIMAKKSLRLIPGLGWFMLMSGAVFIDRSNNKSAIASVTQAGDDMKRKNISLWIFPEGTRHLSSEPELLPFKKGAFYLAVQSGVPIVPVVCQNYHHLFNGKTRFKSGTIKIKVLPPIPTTGLTAADVPKLVEQTREAMLKTLREIHHTSISDSPPASGPRRPIIAKTASQEELLPRASITSSSSPSYGTGANPRNARTNEEEESVEETLQSPSEETQIAPQTIEANGVSGSKSNGNGGKGKKGKKAKQLSIAMISDFFLPVIGGVEGHIYSLSVELMKRGHRVIVITHHHDKRKGIRYLAPGLKVYHLPIVPIASQATLPQFLLFLPYFRHIMIRERIDLVHGHGTLSSLAHEAMYHSHLLGIRSVFTDHSLFGFGDAVGVLTNKLLAGALRNVDGVICVSNTGRENTVLRAQLDPKIVSVIPNALIAEQFTPNPSAQDPDHITIITLSRLVYRKGIDLLVASAPTICDLFPNVRFIVGGDGPKMVEMEQMREKYRLQDRITLLGSIKPHDVQSVLNKGQIYLNTSLTEAFGISIIEAASAGLFVVSTKVGGIPEILPDDMIEFARADEDDVIRALSKAIETVQADKHDPLLAHERVKGMYAWSDVAHRTEVVYDNAISSPRKDTYERLSRLVSLGIFFGPILCCIMAVQHYFFWFLEWYDPREGIDLVEDVWSAEHFEKEVAREKREFKQL